MAEQCSAVGISVKYGKKVLGKLERAAAVRQSLRSAQAYEELEAAVTQGRGLRRWHPGHPHEFVLFVCIPYQEWVHADFSFSSQ